MPKNDSGDSGLDDGGLRNWSLVGGTWMLDYTLSAGLDLVPNTDAAGTTGLHGLTGAVETIGGARIAQARALQLRASPRGCPRPRTAVASCRPPAEHPAAPQP